VGTKDQGKVFGVEVGYGLDRSLGRTDAQTSVFTDRRDDLESGTVGLRRRERHGYDEKHAQGGTGVRRRKAEWTSRGKTDIKDIAVKCREGRLEGTRRHCGGFPPDRLKGEKGVGKAVGVNSQEHTRARSVDKDLGEKSKKETRRIFGSNELTRKNMSRIR